MPGTCRSPGSPSHPGMSASPEAAEAAGVAAVVAAAAAATEVVDRLARGCATGTAVLEHVVRVGNLSVKRSRGTLKQAVLQANVEVLADRIANAADALTGEAAVAVVETDAPTYGERHRRSCI